VISRKSHTGRAERAFEALRAEVAALIGAVLGTMRFMEINRHAPDSWGWSANWAAWLMQADPVRPDISSSTGTTLARQQR